MGIHERDYMKRRREADEQSASNYLNGSSAGDSLGRFLQKHPRFFHYLAAVVISLIVLGIILTKTTEGH